MYLDFLVKIPEAPGKLVRVKKGNTTYIDYEYDRTYDSDKKYTTPKRSTIGKLSKADNTMMQPNQNFLKFFPEAELPEEKDRTCRSSCLRVGTYIVIKKIMRDCGLPEILGRYFNEKELGLFLDLASYSIISENNAGQYYPDYAYNHPLLTKGMRIYSDSKVSDFLNSISEDQSVDFLNDWNETKDHREKIYISYDSTNKNCQAGEIEMAEYGHAKDDKGLPIFNYAIAYDTHNNEPLFYEKYPGSINDVSQLQFMLDKAQGYGYKKIGFILDRGYFSKGNIEFMDRCGYEFVIMVKGMASFVNQLVLDNKGKFESKRICNIPDYNVYGMTVKKKLYVTDETERYFHIYHSISKESSERMVMEAKLQQMTRYLNQHTNEIKEFGTAFNKYFELYYDDNKERFLFATEQISVIEREIDLCGYFIIITSRKMTAKEAINLYKSRDVSEKLFRGDKSYLGNKSLRVHSDESASAKIFIEFIALIIRNKIYTCLKEEMKNLDKKPNYMTVPAAMRELEKIEMVRQLDNVYRLDHAITATQKTILKAFSLDAAYIKYRATEISNELKI
ncbi:IS1634 family transposase [Anaerobium acetethylicum]|uniref:Transposase DDE domain-containing protein n=1 Tax=Anaerobium acetethylicum TaxID=1619234 RepID=A0A1D3TYR5_9FIRM|nr:transposase [Anaerobium acetethylicum]SCP99642.1 Transposase DDE domain-containing protein [Anaerobium acetethylicum]